MSVAQPLPRASGEVLLEGRGLVKHYGGLVAVDNVDLVVRAGEVLGLVGPNGAGKTTLVDIISGVQSADRGTLSLVGRRLKGPSSARAKLGLSRTFQYPQLALSLTVRENLLLGRSAARHRSVATMALGVVQGMFGLPSATDRREVDAIADELGIIGLDRQAGDLTLGEQRLVEVGRALAQDTVVMLLDEPFAGSDAHGIAGISEVIRTVRQRGHGVILVDHNVDLVSALVDRIVLLERGRVAFEGDPRECIMSPEMQRVYFGVVEADDVVVA